MKTEAALAVGERANPCASKAPLWAKLTATFFGVGLMHPGPGTCGSAVTVILWWLLTRFIAASYQPFTAAGLAGLAILIGIPAATALARATSLKDPQFVVIDEVAGQLITFIAVPATWQCVLAGFILFRAFDMLKPPPVRQLERLPEGYGIVIDDVGAGLYALAVMQLLSHYRILPH